MGSTSVRSLSATDRARVERCNQQLAGKALRVLGFAYKEVSALEAKSAEKFSGIGAPPFLETDLIWLGLVGLSDPVRAGVDKFVSAFQQTGIKTVMITGDQSPTARAFASF